jgi:hypothetical protein
MTTRRGEPIAPLNAGKTVGPWRCFKSNISVAVTPLRNLTGYTDRQNFVEAFTDNSSRIFHGTVEDFRCSGARRNRK